MLPIMTQKWFDSIRTNLNIKYNKIVEIDDRNSSVTICTKYLFLITESKV